MTQQIETTELVTGTWSIDPSHSEVGFSVRHLMSKVKGTFADFTGTITTTSANPVDSSVEVTIVSSSISTNNAQRDGHLKSADFFDPTNGGSLAFVSKSIHEGADGYVISGDLTINGITKPVTFDVEFDGYTGDPWNNHRAGVYAQATVNRNDWGITWNAPLESGGMMLNERVKLELDLQITTPKGE